MTHRRFPPPWTIEEANNACFLVRDNTGQTLGYFYFEDESGRRSAAKPQSWYKILYPSFRPTQMRTG